jgi:murein DD-endopeptidase MepM/ murein hydrolase activator NlpD
VKHGTPIKATRDGQIKYLGLNGGYGKFIKITHDNDYETAYAHLSHYNGTLKVGSHVSKGQVIGYVGTTGKSTGPHLHYEIIHKNMHVDPIVATKTLYVQNQNAEDIENIRIQVAEIKNTLVKAPYIDKLY